MTDATLLATSSGLQRTVTRSLRRRRAHEHVLPDFLVIGTQKGGTTSLFTLLTEHPAVVPPASKELHFFDAVRPRPLWRYRVELPTVVQMQAAATPLRRAVTGEATPSYLYFPYVPARVRAVVPACRLIALLRDPVERAWSHWRMSVARGVEDLDFEAALEAEPARIAEAARRRDRRRIQQVSYASRGLYAEQLMAWYAHFPREQILLARSEDLFSDPSTVTSRVLEHIGIPAVEGLELGHHRPVADGTAEEHPLDPAVRARLAERFVGPNERLAELTGVELGGVRRTSAAA